MDAKYKVLMVHNHYQIPGGEDTVVANEKKMLEDYGHTVVLYTRDNNELKSFTRLQKLGLPFTTIFNFKTYRDVRHIIDEQKIDIVHVHNTLNLISPSVYYVALSKKVPVVQTIHNFRLLCPQATFYREGHVCEDCLSKGLNCALKHKCYRNSRLQTLACVLNTNIHRYIGIYRKINYICLTDFNKTKLLQMKKWFSSQIFVKPNFVEKTDIKCERGNSFVYVGRLDESKGVMDLLEAWEQLGDEMPELKICGNGPLEGECLKFIENNHLKNVHLLGFVTHERTLEIIASSKFIILPTRWYEGLPMVIIEAFSLGTPAIVPNAGNAGNLVTEGVTGYKYEFQNVKSLCEVIKKAMQSKDLTDLVNKEYEAHFTREANMRMLGDIYEDILQNRL